MIRAFCDEGAGPASLIGRHKEIKKLEWLRTDKGESGQNVCLPDSTVSLWNRESQGLLSPDSSQPRIKFTLGKPKTKAAPASTLSSPVFRGPIRGHTGPCKGS